MATRIPPAECMECLAAYRAAEENLGEAYKAFPQHSKSGFQRRIAKGKELEKIDPAIKEAMASVNTDMVPNLAWIKTDGKGNTSYSLQMKPATEESPENIIDRIADRLNDIQPAPYIKRTAKVRSDLLNFVPVFDVHLSMRVGDYGTKEAVDRLITGGRDIFERMPAAETSIIVNGGDFTHQNDPSNQTPQSKHPLPVDGEYDDTTDIATDITVDLIDIALQRSEQVIYKALKGNHDPHTARILRAALRQRYRDNDRVAIDSDGIDFFAHEWGGNLICAHHGDIKRKANDIVLGFAAKYAEAWGRTKYRDLWTGHLHHLKVQEFAGMTSNQVRAICPADRHSIENLYAAQSEMIGVTYQKGGGRYGVLQHVF